MTPFIPLDLPADVVEHGGHAHGFVEHLPGLGFLALVLVALVAGYLALRSRGLLPAIALPTSRRSGRPEDAAKQILAERFAHGDLSSEEFMERASVLNWTPGVEALRPRPVGRG